MSKILKILVLAAAYSSLTAWANLTPGARQFTGQVDVNSSAPTPCYVEILYSPDLSAITVRSISTLQHLSPSGELIWVALGSYTASFVGPKSLYRYQDGTPGATVKDLVVNTNPQTSPTKHGVLFWHAQAGHHDPVICENLTEVTSPEGLVAIDEVFAKFDELKP